MDIQTATKVRDHLLGQWTNSTKAFEACKAQVPTWSSENIEDVAGLDG